jgi:hypothetical protein
MKLPDEKHSHEVQRTVVEEAPRASFDEVVELIRKQRGADVPKQQIEELAVRVATLTHSIATGSVRQKRPTI